MLWSDPKLVDNHWFWMDTEQYRNEKLLRCGRVSWDKKGGLYSPSIWVGGEHGLGLYCWPDFHTLSDAQHFVERLMALSVADLMREHGSQWPGVVL